MRLLAIETASEACSVALSAGAETLQRFRIAPRGHADLLLPWVSELLAEAGLGLQDLDAIAFSRGPGSFTSLRIGIGVVQGLAWGADLPVVPVSSLQATAQAALGDGVVAAVVAMDARMQEVYCGAFSKQGTGIDTAGIMTPASVETVCSPADVVRPPIEGFAGVGNGWARYEELRRLGTRLVSVHPDTWPTAAALLELGAHWLEKNAALPAELAQPVYIRDKVAEKSA